MYQSATHAGKRSDLDGTLDELGRRSVCKFGGAQAANAGGGLSRLAGSERDLSREKPDPSGERTRGSALFAATSARKARGLARFCGRSRANSPTFEVSPRELPREKPGP